MSASKHSPPPPLHLHVKSRLTGGSGPSSRFTAPPPLQTPSNRAPPSILFTGGYGCLQSLTRFHYTPSYNLWTTLSTSALITQPSPAPRAVICYLFIHLRRRVPRLTCRLMHVCVGAWGVGPCECLKDKIKSVCTCQPREIWNGPIPNVRQPKTEGVLHLEPGGKLCQTA